MIRCSFNLLKCQFIHTGYICYQSEVSIINLTQIKQISLICYMNQMIRAKTIPDELTRNYYQDQESKSIAFVNAFSGMSSCLDDYLNEIRDIISSQEPTVVRKNLLEFLKLMTNLKYLNPSSKFSNSIFEDLMKIGLNRNKYQEQFELAMLMLTHEDTQMKYLEYLVECLGINYGHPNSSLFVLHRLMRNSLLLLEGKMKGPAVTSTSIDNLVNLCMKQVNFQPLDFTNAQDCTNFIMVCQSVIKMVRKFATKHVIHADSFKRVWIKWVQKIYYSQTDEIPIDLINAMFGLFEQLCQLKQESFFEKLEEKEMFDVVTNLTQRYILKCESINNFWENYFKIRENIAKPPFQSVNTLSISAIFANVLMVLPQNIGQVAQKIKTADNLILCTTLKCGVMEVKMLSQFYNNPEVQRANEFSFIQASFKCLYSNIPDPKDKDSYSNAMIDLAKLLQFLKSKKVSETDSQPNLISLYNFLPPVKIVMSRNSQFVMDSNNMETIVQVLLEFINKIPDKATDDKQLFLNFIQQISVCFKQEIKKIHSSERSKINTAYTRVMDIFDRSLKNIKRNSENLKCIRYQVLAAEYFLNLIIDSQFKESFFYVEKILDLVRVRKSFDEDVKRILSNLITSSGRQDRRKVSCFETLQKIVLQQQKIMYIELLFDFAETHYNDQKIMKFMRNSKSRILSICSTTRYLDVNSCTRNINFNVTLQLVTKNINSSSDIGLDLNKFIHEQPVKFSVYHRLLEIINKENSVVRTLKKQNPQIGTNISVLFQFSNLLIKMLQRMNDTQATNECTWKERAQLYEIIGRLLLKYVCDIIKIDKDGQSLLKLRNDIEWHTNKIKVLKCIGETNFLKYMTAARLTLQSSTQPQMVVAPLQEDMVNINAMNMKQLTADYASDPAGAIITLGISRKLLKKST